jgi:lipid-A-disaccharide synthase-like uncharacterized protein
MEENTTTIFGLTSFYIYCFNFVLNWLFNEHNSLSDEMTFFWKINISGLQSDNNLQIILFLI